MSRKESNRKDQDPNDGISSGLIQFRANQTLIAQLSAVADRLQTPVGALARQWVAERLSKEITVATDSVLSWQTERFIEIDKRLTENMEYGPVQILQIMPLARETIIKIQDAEKLASMFTPVERANATLGRINRLGYYTEKIFKNSVAVNGRELTTGYVQLFKTGQLESVRILAVDEEEHTIFGDQLDSDLIRAVWLYCSALQALKVPTPLIISVTFKRIKNYRIRSRAYNAPTSTIDEYSFSTKPVEVLDWTSLMRPGSVAQTLKPLLDEVWNAAGFDHSGSYSANGIWKGF